MRNAVDKTIILYIPITVKTVNIIERIMTNMYFNAFIILICLLNR